MMIILALVTRNAQLDKHAIMMLHTYVLTVMNLVQLAQTLTNLVALSALPKFLSHFCKEIASFAWILAHLVALSLAILASFVILIALIVKTLLLLALYVKETTLYLNKPALSNVLLVTKLKTTSAYHAFNLVCFCMKASASLSALSFGKQTWITLNVSHSYTYLESQ